jgi:hypothetical protein
MFSFDMFEMVGQFLEGTRALFSQTRQTSPRAAPIWKLDHNPLLSPAGLPSRLLVLAICIAAISRAFVPGKAGRYGFKRPVLGQLAVGRLPPFTAANASPDLVKSTK